MVPAYQTLAEGLRADIVSGRLRPGDRLPTEPQLCARSGLSRSTVREALRLLTSQHLIVTVRGVNGGSFVAAPSVDQLGTSLAEGIALLLAAGAVTSEHILEARTLLEVPAAGLAARHRTDEDLLRLAEAIADSSAAPDNRLAPIRAFHLAVAAATGNPVLELALSPLHLEEDRWGFGETMSPQTWDRIDADHRALLDAIRDGDEDRAAEIARVHLDALR